MAYLATHIFPADGVTTQWDFEFAGVNPDIASGPKPYLFPEDVKANELYIDGSGNVQVIPRTLTINPLMPTRAIIAGAPVAAGRQVKIFRQTEIRFPLVDYRDRQAVSELDLDLANRQAIFIAQETLDAAASQIQLDAANNFDANGNRIINVGDAVGPQDAVNLRTFERAIRVPSTEPTVNPLPAIADRANRLLSFDVAGQPVAVLANPGTATELELRLRDATNPLYGDAIVAVQTPTAQAEATTQHEVNKDIVNLRRYGARDDWNGTTGTDNTPALSAMLADYPNGGTIVMPKTRLGTGVYHFVSTPNGTDMSKFTLDAAPDVSLHIVGGNHPFLSPGLRTVRSLNMYMATLQQTNRLSANSLTTIPDKKHFISASEGEAPLTELIVPNAARTFEFVEVTPTSETLAATTASADASSVSFGTLGVSSFKVGTVPIRPGQAVYGRVALSAGVSAGCIFLELENGWAMYEQPKAGVPNWTQHICSYGSPVQTVAFAHPFIDAPAYRMGACELGIRVHNVNEASILLNGAEVFMAKLPGNIVRVGWGAGRASNSDLAYITRTYRVRNSRSYASRPLTVGLVGDSTMAWSNNFNTANHFIRNATGVNGIQFKKVTNFAVPGHAALQQRNILVATPLANYDYLLIDIGINDYSGGSTVAVFVQSVEDMVAHCVTYGVTPIVVLPAQFYDQPDAAPYGQIGTGSYGAASGCEYRGALIQRMVALGVHVSYTNLHEMGPALPSLLGNPDVDPILGDNVHQTGYGGELKGRGLAKTLVGYMFNRVRKDQAFRVVPARWCRTLNGFGNQTLPAIGVTGDVVFLGNTVNIPDSPGYGSLILTLPQCYAPQQQLFVTCAASAAGSPSGPYPLQIQLRIDPDGKVYTQAPVATVVYIHLGALSWALRA